MYYSQPPQPQMNQPNMGMYQNFNPQMNNTYMDRMAQLQQQYQQNIQPLQQNIGQQGGLIGKVVNDFSEITANDVPMNGISAVFPKADMSEVQLRTWGADGKIQTISYKPILEQKEAEDTNIPQMDFNGLNEDMRAFREDATARLDRMESLLTNLELNQAKIPTKANSRAKKGDDEE